MNYVVDAQFAISEILPATDSEKSIAFIKKGAQVIVISATGHAEGDGQSLCSCYGHVEGDVIESLWLRIVSHAYDTYDTYDAHDAFHKVDVQSRKGLIDFVAVCFWGSPSAVSFCFFHRALRGLIIFLVYR